MNDSRRDTTTPKGFKRSRVIASNYKREVKRVDSSTPRDKEKSTFHNKLPLDEKDEFMSRGGTRDERQNTLQTTT